MSITTGIESAGADLGSIFAAYVSGTKVNCGILSSGTDLGQLFQPIGSGSSDVAATGIEAEGKDLNEWFVAGAPAINPNYSAMAATGSTPAGKPLTVTVDMTVSGNGIWTDTAKASEPTTGNWYNPTTANIGNSYYVSITFTKTGGSLGSYSAVNVSSILIGTSSQTGSASLEFAAGGSSTATASGTCQVIISTDAAQNNVVSNQTVTFSLEVQVT